MICESRTHYVVLLPQERIFEIKVRFKRRADKHTRKHTVDGTCTSDEYLAFIDNGFVDRIQ